MPADEEHAIHAEVRHQGRRYGAETYPSGLTYVTRNGAWVCNANWNGRFIDCGDNEIHHDLYVSSEILEALATALVAAGARERPIES